MLNLYGSRGVYTAFSELPDGSEFTAAISKDGDSWLLKVWIKSGLCVDLFETRFFSLAAAKVRLRSHYRRAFASSLLLRAS